jgi:hypothetical protein
MGHYIYIYNEMGAHLHFFFLLLPTYVLDEKKAKKKWEVRVFPSAAYPFYLNLIVTEIFTNPP